MKKISLIAMLLFATPLALVAKPQSTGHWGVGVAAVGGSVSPGLGYYHPQFEFGLDATHYVSPTKDNTTVLAVWGGLRRAIAKHLNVVSGASVATVFEGGTHTHNISPYLGLDVTHLSSLPVLLGAWINPVTLHAHSSGPSGWTIGSGGIKLVYLF